MNILKKYLNAYTTLLKEKPSPNNPFSLVYSDAFAGTGEVSIRNEQDPETREIPQGSARIACEVEHKPFDRLVFIEKDPDKVKTLHSIEPDSQRIVVRNKEANQELRWICEYPWQKHRAVVFLDPFALEVEWATIEAIAQTKAMDTWILFPVAAIRRMLPRTKLPDVMAPRLTSVFGDESWRELYRESDQPSLFGEVQWSSDRGSGKIVQLYKRKLESIFAGVAPTSRTLYTIPKTHPCTSSSLL